MRNVGGPGFLCPYYFFLANTPEIFAYFLSWLISRIQSTRYHPTFHPIFIFVSPNLLIEFHSDLGTLGFFLRSFEDASKTQEKS